MKKNTAKIILYLFLASLYLFYIVFIEENLTFLTIYLSGLGLGYISDGIVKLIYNDSE